MGERDWAAEMRALIDAETSHGPYVSRRIARDIVDKLTATDAELLSGWLYAQAEQLIWAAINERDRAARAAARVSAPQAFAEAAEEHIAGLPRRLRQFLQARYVVQDGSRRELGTLTQADLRFVAKTYADRARSNAFEAAFFRALARRVNSGTVADHFTEEQIMLVRDSIRS
jgi:hypothetical protein